MKKNIFTFLLTCLSLALAAQNKQLTIIHTNDTHSQIYPLSPNLSDTMRANRGGFLRRLAMLKEERAKDKELLLFDSGDFSQGTPYYNLFKGDVEIELMNRMGYDAGTIGNHEFDFGLENMTRLFKKLNFPILCANYDFGNTELAKIVKPYIILKRKGVKIGIFGLSTYLEGLVEKKNYGPLKYLDPISTAQGVINKLKSEGCEVIICLSHLGLNIEGISDEELVAGTRGLDLVLGGHSHSFLQELVYIKDLDGHNVGIDQNGKSGLYIGKILLNMKKIKQ
ncbi:MAG: metallophosphoesterase [Prevotella sp.]|nr:metallophosphoesterase [Prevotella sp.]MDD7273052.1 metallophosphoesterase [Prevotellaceae bacterium]MDY3935749.1 metallophosphoesterase [Prevotella sp.]MDY4217705.1 metallophosphoesterase [Prevotella sp.]